VEKTALTEACDNVRFLSEDVIDAESQWLLDMEKVQREQELKREYERARV
jgi:hypothetical protein